MKKKVIIVTDGDKVAKSCVEKAAEKLNLRCISSSAGNPTELEGKEIKDLVMESEGLTVLVMVDDRGRAGQGKGERVTEYLVNQEDIEIIGALAVASNSPAVEPINPDKSITLTGDFVSHGVDKDGVEVSDNKIYGDTVENLESLGIDNIIGIGDIGKMCGKDSIAEGVPVTIKAIEEILKINGV
ncbi:stage V sporulation protein AE [Proteinivorax hydrogeniformans]|uniref:Stage V sporulation protein AE n=1 Tax=Proteinivorax hydrogeniformans TaxID=1826727 RepID=A0AAU8HQM8_9FIRM